jgi:predicted ATP-dependent serine protease
MLKKRGRKPKPLSASKTPIKLEKMADFKYDASLFTPIKTGHVELDNFFSTDGGLMPATNIMAVGDPGAGKSTVLLDVISNIQLFNKKERITLMSDGTLKNTVKSQRKVLFISGEMNQIDMVGYCKRYPKFNQIDILFTSKYLDQDPTYVLESVLDVGYDVVLIDSWAEVAESIRDYKKWDRRKSEHYMLNLLEKHNNALNKGEKHTSFIIIQQVTKGGDFVGSNRLKHMTTGMMYIRLKGTDERTMYFVKNRRGKVGEVISFSLLNENVSYGVLDTVEEDEFIE